MKEDYQKAFKKLTLFFLLNPVPFNGQNYQKQKESGTSLQVTKQVQKKSFICYILSDQVLWCNVKQFLSYSKNYICKFMQVNSWHHKLFHFHLSFWIWKVWKGREKLQKIEYLENEKSFFDEIKNIFHSFWKATIWWKKYQTQALKVWFKGIMNIKNAICTWLYKV